MITAFIKRIHKNYILKYTTFTVFVIPFFVNAQKKDTITNPLSEVIITSISPNKKLNTSAENIQFLTKENLKAGNGFDYSSVLNKVPGVFMQSGALNTNRITIRGIGARSPFGTTSIRAYFGEIPLTDGNGNSVIEDWELGSISNIEIHKGPAASSFGVGLGGTIILRPDYEELNSNKVTIENTSGSFGLQRLLIKAGISNAKAATNLVYSCTKSNGYRENNNYNRQTFTATSLLNISKKDTLQFLGNYTNLKAFIPSSVNLDTYNSNPKSAATTWKNAQGFEDFYSILGGLSWKHSFTPSTQLSSTIFTSVKENNEPRPFNILKENTHAFGIRSRLTRKRSKKTQWGIGGELFYDKANIRTFENKYSEFPIGTGSIQGALLSNLNEQRIYYNLFGELSYTFHKKWNLSAGINQNQTGYIIKDQFNTGSESNSGNYIFNPILSPKIGLLYTPNTHVNFLASISHGFAPPTTEETLLPEGNINPNLKPERGWNFEIGSRFAFFKNRLYGDLSIYLLKVADLLVSRRAENEELFAINAGKTNHLGIEGNLNYTIYNSKPLNITGFSNYSIYQYYFDNFVDNDTNFSGNKLTGIPSGVFNSGIIMKTILGIYGNISYQYVGRIPSNDSNSVYNNAYQLVNAQLGFQLEPYKKLNLKAFVGINNILNTKYVSQLQVNASGFGGNAPRYYYAGNPENYYGGINLSYLIK